MGSEPGHPCLIHEAEAITILALLDWGVVELWGTWPKPRGDDKLDIHNRLCTGET